MQRTCACLNHHHEQEERFERNEKEGERERRMKGGDEVNEKVRKKEKKGRMPG